MFLILRIDLIIELSILILQLMMHLKTDLGYSNLTIIEIIQGFTED
jgi:hypothetical protein